jgi:hypothetical protein
MLPAWVQSGGGEEWKTSTHLNVYEFLNVVDKQIFTTKILHCIMFP